MQELTSIFTPSFLSLANSGTLFLFLFSHLPITWPSSREKYQDTSLTKLAILLEISWTFTFCGGILRAILFTFLFALGHHLWYKKKKKTVPHHATLESGDFWLWRATEREKPVPDGFVPALPSDPYKILAYFTLPAHSLERLSSLFISYSVFVSCFG